MSLQRHNHCNRLAKGAPHALLRFTSVHPARLDRPGSCPLGGPFDEGANLFSPRKRGDPPAVSGQLECSAMPNSGKIQAADWPWTCAAVGGLSIYRSVDVN